MGTRRKSHRVNATADLGAEVKLTTGLEKERIIAERPATTLSMGGNLVLPNSWSGNGEYVLTTNSGTGQEPSYLALFKIGDLKPVRMLAGKGNQTNGQISPDGKWLAYASDESGGWNIYATTFPSGAGKWQVSVGGGTEPRWRDDGKEMFYLDAKGMLTAVSISAGSGCLPAVRRNRSSACARGRASRIPICSVTMSRRTAPDSSSTVMSSLPLSPRSTFC